MGRKVELEKWMLAIPAFFISLAVSFVFAMVAGTTPNASVSIWLGYMSFIFALFSIFCGAVTVIGWLTE